MVVHSHTRCSHLLEEIQTHWKKSHLLHPLCRRRSNPRLRANARSNSRQRIFRESWGHRQRGPNQPLQESNQKFHF